MNLHRDEWTGETKETPGMVRWSNDSEYFIKRRPDSKRFQIGLESKIADGTYIFHTSIEFDDDEAPDLMDRIAKFNDLPTYSALLKARDDLLRLRNYLKQPEVSQTQTTRAILADIDDILDGVGI